MPMNKVLLGLIHVNLLFILHGCVCVTMATQSSWDRDLESTKPTILNLCIWPFMEKVCQPLL